MAHPRMIDVPATRVRVGLDAAALAAFVDENARLITEQFAEPADDENVFDHLKRLGRVTDRAMLRRAALPLVPRREVSVGAFAIDATRVTCEAYARFCRETRTPPPAGWRGARPPRGRETFPVVGVSYWDALAYAAWRGAELPTEVEWEIAAGSADGRRYPWGDAWAPAMSALREAGEPGAHEAAAFPELASPAGVLGLIGSSWEWCADAFGPLPGGDEAAFAARHARATPEWRAIRGGIVWDVQCGVAVREGAAPDETDKLGFRCVVRKREARGAGL